MILNLHIVSSCSILQYQKKRNAGSLQTLYLVPQLILSFPSSIFLTTANTKCSIYDPVSDLSHNPPEPGYFAPIVLSLNLGFLQRWLSCIISWDLSISFSAGCSDFAFEFWSTEPATHLGINCNYYFYIGESDTLKELMYNN